MPLRALSKFVKLFRRASSGHSGRQASRKPDSNLRDAGPASFESAGLQYEKTTSSESRPRAERADPELSNVCFEPLPSTSFEHVGTAGTRLNEDSEDLEILIILVPEGRSVPGISGFHFGESEPTARCCGPDVVREILNSPFDSHGFDSSLSSDGYPSDDATSVSSSDDSAAVVEPTKGALAPLVAAPPEQPVVRNVRTEKPSRPDAHPGVLFLAFSAGLLTVLSLFLLFLGWGLQQDPANQVGLLAACGPRGNPNLIPVQNVGAVLSPYDPFCPHVLPPEWNFRFEEATLGKEVTDPFPTYL